MGFGAGEKDEARLVVPDAGGGRMRATGRTHHACERHTREQRTKCRQDYRINADTHQHHCRGSARKRALGTVVIIQLPSQETADDRGSEERPGGKDEVAVDHDRARNRGEAEENWDDEPPNDATFEPAPLRQHLRFDRSGDEDGEIEIRSGIMVKMSISRCVYRRIQPRDASFWANFCGVFYSNDHVANYMQLHMVTAEPENQS